MTLDVDKGFREKKAKNYTLAKQKATELQWSLCDKAIEEFIGKYPLYWLSYQREMNRTKMTNINNPFAEATEEHKELKSARWRNVLSFPVIESDDGIMVESLKTTIDKIIPELTHKDSVNLYDFVKRYPFLCPAQHNNVGG